LDIIRLPMLFKTFSILTLSSYSAETHSAGLTLPPEIGTSSSDWAQLSRFYQKNPVSEVLCVLNKDRMIDIDKYIDDRRS
jgi:hypothetical protein